MKKYYALIIAVLLAVPLVISAADREVPEIVKLNTGNGAIFPMDGKYKVHGSFTAMTTVNSIASSNIDHSTYGPAQLIIFSVESAAVRCTWHGVSPTVTGTSQVGHKLGADSSFIIPGHDNVGNFRCINETAGNGSVIMYTISY